MYQEKRVSRAIGEAFYGLMELSPEVPKRHKQWVHIDDSVLEKCSMLESNVDFKNPMYDWYETDQLVQKYLNRPNT